MIDAPNGSDLRLMRVSLFTPDELFHASVQFIIIFIDTLRSIIMKTASYWSILNNENNNKLTMAWC